jgi:hypothetical protein
MNVKTLAVAWAAAMAATWLFMIIEPSSKG